MKYLLLINVILTVLVGCNMDQVNTPKPSSGAADYYEAGMHYQKFWNYNGGVYVVNVTKDSLECEERKQALKFLSDHEK